MPKYRYEKISPESVEARRRYTDQLDFINEAGQEGGRLVCIDPLGWAYMEFVEEEPAAAPAQPVPQTPPVRVETTARKQRARVPGT